VTIKMLACSVVQNHNTGSKTLRLLEMREMGTFWYQMWNNPCVEHNLSLFFFPPELFKTKVILELSFV